MLSITKIFPNSHIITVSIQNGPLVHKHLFGVDIKYKLLLEITFWRQFPMGNLSSFNKDIIFIVHL